MDAQKTIVISGYYGFNNVGDEAVLTSIIQDVGEQMPEAKVIVLSDNPVQTEMRYQVEAVNRWDIKSIAKVIQASDLLISGGGSLLQDVTSMKTIPYYLGIVKIAQWYKKPVVFYSQGIGPVNKKLSRILVRMIADRANHIFVREEASKALLKEIGIKKAPITVTIDPVLGIKVKKEIQEKVAASMGEKPAVGIYLRTWAADKKLVDELIPVVQHILNLGYQIYAIPMYYKEDSIIAKELARVVEGDIHVVDRELSIDEVVAYTAQFEWIIGMRLHSLIMAHAVETPMIGLSYDPKVKGFIKEVGGKYCMDSNQVDAAKLNHYIDELTQNIEQEIKHIQHINKQKQDKIIAPAKYIKEILK